MGLAMKSRLGVGAQTTSASAAGTTWAVAKRDRWVFGLFFVSGFTGLVYEVLWMKELGLLFGNTAHAAATTLASFFLGLAGGGYVLGRRIAASANPLKVYAALEFGVAASALAYFWLLDAYHALYPALVTTWGIGSPAVVAAKFLLAVIVLFPPAFFMGGTFPVMAQVMAPRTEGLPRTGPALYAVNTFGAALGAYAAGFHLPVWFGFSGAYGAAIALTGTVALCAWRIAPRWPSSEASNRAPNPPGAVLRAPGLAALAFASGFAALALEVLWTRLFAQVLQNSVYTFSVVLVCFLAALAIGAALAGALARRAGDPRLTLCGLLAVAAVGVAATPQLFVWVTGGMTYLGGQVGFAGYVAQAFGVAAAVMLIPGALLGTVFPYLMKIGARLGAGTGRTVGDLAAANTLGAIVGATAAGFFLLRGFGLGTSILLLATLYLAAALAVAWRTAVRVSLAAVGASLAVALVVLVGLPPPVRIDPATETLHEVWEGSAATVAVVEQRRTRRVTEFGAGARLERTTSRRIKINNHYHVGGTESRQWEAWQTHLPLFLHPNPQRVFYLGMGTGITAGAALEHPVKRVVVAEIVPEVITASRRYFAPYVNGLFEDARAEVLAEDGRHYLHASRERFDVIIADLFMPWKAGTASLYTREHYATVRNRLSDDGLFAQWLPLYQMSQQEVGIVARSLLDSFPLVTVWRGDFFSQAPAIVLIGHARSGALSREALAARLRSAPGPARADTPLKHFVPEAESRLGRPGLAGPAARFMLYYAGNLTVARAMFDAYPVNTDDRPVIEYLAPMTERRQTVGQSAWLVGFDLLSWFEDVLRHAPPTRDPYLSRHPVAAMFAAAGLDFFRVQVWGYADNQARARPALERFTATVFGNLHGGAGFYE